MSTNNISQTGICLVPLTTYVIRTCCCAPFIGIGIKDQFVRCHVRPGVGLAIICRLHCRLLGFIMWRQVLGSKSLCWCRRKIDSLLIDRSGQLKTIHREPVFAYVMKDAGRLLMLPPFRTAIPIALVIEATSAGVGEYCKTLLCSHVGFRIRVYRESLRCK